MRCGEAEGYIAVRGDCNDTDPSVHPGAADTAADGLDQNCGGTDGADPHVAFSSGSAQTIQAALNDAAEAATIWVAAGTYLEHDSERRNGNKSPHHRRWRVRSKP